MATFLMIHGAWHGGWCFERLRAPLEALGHGMVAPDLPGMDGDATTLASTTLAGWADFVINAAAGLPSPVILCGHSRGGIVISQAAERAPDRIAALIYIAAALVPDGKSLYDLLALRQTAEVLSFGLRVVADGHGVAMSASAARQAFYNRCSAADQEASAGRLAIEPAGPLATKLQLSETRFGRVPRHYLECLDDRTFPVSFQRSMQASLPCTSVTSLDSDHSPFLCQPLALAQALHNISERIEA